MDLIIRPITVLDPFHIEVLVRASEREGYRFVRRMVDDWIGGRQRFDAAGEILYGAFDGESWIATGGLTRDPFVFEPLHGRVRRMYVHPDYRGQGVGRSLLGNVIQAAQGQFAVLNLYTDNPIAAKMYEGAGFQPVSGEKITHSLRLNKTV